MMSEWITDRPPTEPESDEHGCVWITCEDGTVTRELFSCVDKGDPWQPIAVPYRFQVWVWVCRDGVPAIEHYSNVCDDLAWMPLRVPEPYVAPIDTSLAASIERMEKASEHEYKSPQEYGADLERIIEAARKWDVMANQGKCVQGFSQSYGVKCSKCGHILSIPVKPGSPGVFEIEDLFGWSFTTGGGWRCPNCQPSYGPSQGPEPGASGSNDPSHFAGSSRSVGEAELPDPGEGWELCSKNKGEQWCVVFGKTQYAWQDGKNKYADFHRRRVVMTQRPVVEWPSPKLCWRYDVDEKIWVPSDTDVVRQYWKSGETLAWCHRLEDETDPPQFALDWEKERQ